MRVYRTLCRHCHKVKATGADGLCDACRGSFSKWDTWQVFRGNRHKRGYGNHWNKLRVIVLERDNHLCRECLLCGKYTTATDVDHIIPKSKGGTDDISNLQSLCHECHKKKTRKDLTKA